VLFFAKSRNYALITMPTFQTNPKPEESILDNKSIENMVPITFIQQYHCHCMLGLKDSSFDRSVDLCR
jgi:hypothetical protein